MKKIYLSLFCTIALFLNVQAKPITSEQAIAAARSILGEKVSVVWDGIDHRTRAANESAPFYLVSREGGGWVMLAGDDSMEPVIGWSDTDDFRIDEMPANVRYVLDCIKSHCKPVPEKYSQRNEAWDRMLLSTRAALTPVQETKNLQTNEWSQNAPYNNMYPECGAGQGAENNRYWSGCIPTAFAIVMAYHGWANPNGSITANYEVPAGSYRIYTAESTYSLTGHDYNLTQLKELKTHANATGASAELQSALSLLVYDCGILSRAFLTPGSGTTAYFVNDLITYFGDHMGYNKAARKLTAASYSEREWISIMKAQIDASQPVIYAGESVQSGGHAFVLDGYGTYGSSTVFHFNFGWGGVGNGYFNYKYIEPYNSVEYMNYDNNQFALIDFTPDRNGNSTYAPSFRLETYRTNNVDYKGMKYLDESKEKITVGGIFNNGSANATNFVVALFKVDKNGVRSETPINSTESYPITVNAGTVWYHSSGMSLNKNYYPCQFGDSYVLYYKMDGVSEWTLLPADRSGKIVYEFPAMGGPVIDVPAGFNGGTFPLAIKNNDTPIDIDSDDTYWLVNGDRLPWDTESVNLSTPGTYTITAVMDIGTGARKVQTTVKVTQ